MTTYLNVVWAKKESLTGGPMAPSLRAVGRTRMTPPASPPMSSSLLGIQASLLARWIMSPMIQRHPSLNTEEAPFNVLGWYTPLGKKPHRYAAPFRFPDYWMYDTTRSGTQYAYNPSVFRTTHAVQLGGSCRARTLQLVTVLFSFLTVSPW